jgi:tight adherence protein B
MALVFLTFAAILLVVLAVYWVGVVRPEQQSQLQVRKRLKRAHIAKSGPRLTRDVQRLSDIPAMDRFLQRATSVSLPLERLIARAGFSFTVGKLVLASGCAGAGTFCAVFLLSHLWWIAVATGVLAAYGPFAWLKFKAGRRLLQFEEQFPEAIDLIGRALRAGHAFTTGLAMVAEEAAEPTKGEFRVLYDQQNFGMPLPQAMREFAERIPLLDARFFVTAVLTQREAGGNLAEVLDNLATVIRERFRVKRQVRVATAHARITGWVLVLLPVGLAAAMLVAFPGHLDLLTKDPLGTYMVMAGITLQVIGTLAIRKLVNIEY